MAPRKSAFESEVLTHLEYIKEAQNIQRANIAKLFEKVDNIPSMCGEQLKECNRKFNKIGKDISKTKGFMAGIGFATGAIGTFFGYMISLLTKAWK